MVIAPPQEDSLCTSRVSIRNHKRKLIPPRPVRITGRSSYLLLSILPGQILVRGSYRFYIIMSVDPEPLHVAVLSTAEGLCDRQRTSSKFLWPRRPQDRQHVPSISRSGYRTQFQFQFQFNIQHSTFNIQHSTFNRLKWTSLILILIPIQTHILCALWF